MSQEEYSTKRRRFHHLTKEKRAQIEVLLRQKTTKTEIARMLGIARSTLYNELKRGSVEQMNSDLTIRRAYFYEVGQRVYEEHRLNSRPPLKLAKAYAFIRYAEERIKKTNCHPMRSAGERRWKVGSSRWSAQKRYTTI